MVKSTVEELKRLGIGKKIRSLRDEKQLQLNQLAEKINLQQTLLSQIEDDVVPPTLATLLNIAKELDVSVDYFFIQQSELENVELTRVNERLNVAKSRDSDTARMTYNYQALAYRLKGKRMEPFLVEFDSGIDEKPVPLSHAGEEFCYCLEGQIEFISDENRIILQPGDSLYYFSQTPHVLRGTGPGKPKGIFVLLPE
ncbi:MAG: helix-turn-helix transcriptional regulator [SAR324 cluster bacterium]|nr:helix-turn-helix transcriptional regulator [SAR324 cluster bacterium]MBL7036056.1 helix-turn-helix transcriptional regulator [SAR324 cluster bacterium]